MEIVKLFLIGIIFGIANVIPAVSGGTIAVVFGVYDRLINVITPNVKKILSQWKFLLPIGIGIVIGILLFSKLISVLFENYPLQTNWFFIGIILGSIPMVYKRMISYEKKSDLSLKGFAIPSVSALILCILAFVVMIFMTVTDVTDGNVVQTQFSMGLAIKLFFGLALAAIAMIIPGISGSFIMLALGVYNTIITAVANFNIPLLIPGALGALFGLLGGAGLVRWLIERKPSQTYGAIMGLVLGSILVIFPGFGSLGENLFSLLCVIGGFFLSFFASREKKL